MTATTYAPADATPADVTEDRRALASLGFLEVLRDQVTPVAIFNRALEYVFVNTAFLRLTGVEADDVLGRHVFDAFADTEERMAPFRRCFHLALAGGVARTQARPYDLYDPDGVRRTRYWRTLQEPIRDAGGEVRFVMQTVEDVTERVRLRRERQLVAEEMAHRTKNVLAVVEAMARLASRGTEQSKDDYAADLSRRLRSMSRNHTRLYARDFSGLSLRTLLTDELEGVARTEGLYLEGADVDLPARPAQDLAMVVHELATNAAKYGCFSHPDGELHVSWHCAGDDLAIEWREIGADAAAIGRDEGFGSRLLRMVSHVDVRREGTEDGLLATLEVSGLGQCDPIDEGEE